METNRTQFTGRYKRVGHTNALTVPTELIRLLGLKHGDYIAIERLGDRIVARRISRDYVLGKENVDARKLMRRESELDANEGAKDAR